MRFASVLFLVLFVAGGGCSERLMRENVFAHTETGFGLFVAQNARTQAYEAKAGYLRHELFFVPTGKVVTYGPSTADHGIFPAIFGKPLIEVEVIANRADLTPEVLGEIIAGGEMPNPSGTGGTLKFDVRQKLAVGKEAVRSGGAVALMADGIGEAAAATVIERTTNPPREIRDLQTQIDQLLRDHASFRTPVPYGGRTHTSAEALFDAIAEEEFNDTFDNIYQRGTANQLRTLLETFESTLNTGIPGDG